MPPLPSLSSDVPAETEDDELDDEDEDDDESEDLGD
jgi:hypothetical protein